MKMFRCLDEPTGVVGIYAAITAGKARYLMFLAKDDAGHEARFSDIKVRRLPEFDYMIEKFEVAMSRSMRKFFAQEYLGVLVTPLQERAPEVQHEQ